MSVGNRKIVHIDDDEDDLQLFRRALQSLGSDFELIEATDGADGIKLLQQLKAQNDLPSLIVLDINMPKINGRDACLLIKKDEVLSTIPLVIFSTSSSMMDKMFFQDKNVEYITKPTEYGVLVEVTSRMLQLCSY